MNETLPLAELDIPRVLARQVAAQGHRPFLYEVDSRRSWSYAEVDAWSGAIAGALKSAGVAAGTHVGLLLGNSAEHIGVFLALARLGAVSAPVNTAARGELLRGYLALADAEVIVVDEELGPRLALVLPELPLVKQVLVVRRPAADGSETPAAPLPASWLDLAHVIASASPAAVDPSVRFSTLLLLAFTSGTTGPSKASMLSHAAALTYGTGGIEAHGYRPSDVFYVCLPLFHVNALLTSTLTALLCGASVVLAERFSASRFFDEIRAHRATTTNLLGAMTSFLWSQPPGPADADHSLRLVSMSPMPAFVREFERRFGLAAVTNYGLSDFGTVTSWHAGSPAAKIGSIGKARSCFEVRVVDDDDVECPPGVAGEIVLRTREPWRAATGYYKMPEATAAAHRNQLFHTGDRAWRDDDGFLWFVDRNKDCIRRRGENISSFEVEQMIGRHPAVGAVAAFPVATADGDEEVGIAVVRRDGYALGEVELIEHCAACMSYFMVPRYVRFVDALPTTVNQKVEKFRLKQAMEAELGAVWDRERAGVVVSR